jgi:hypothetical protein
MKMITKLSHLKGKLQVSVKCAAPHMNNVQIHIVQQFRKVYVYVENEIRRNDTENYQVQIPQDLLRIFQ